MPKRLLRKNPVLTPERSTRSKKTRAPRNSSWIDPYPHVLGTLPEKMVYAELSRRGIPFAFQNEINFRIPEIGLSKDYRPDIAIPSMKIIIEVQGSYWHSTTKAIENDAYKFAVYQMLGWRVLAWWDFDILTRLQELFASEPAFSSFPIVSTTASTEYVYTKKINRDDSKGIVTLNKRRAQKNAYKKRAPRLRTKQTKGRKNNYGSRLFS